MKDIAATPLSDLNLVRTKIPDVLTAARKSPYGAPADGGCTALAEQVKALDEVLGPDLDRSRKDTDEGLVERGADFIGETAVDTARHAAAGILPFRSWIRKLSGAERHSKEVSAAIAAGIVRRAYLKGLGQAAGCPAPAAPAVRPAAGEGVSRGAAEPPA
ncbi:hypothetical protein EZJ19_09485 [Parasulfuritortus cantonensis]|uniref:Uncharacterized protein n=1 Tax=Parasulfuritortus cantonensis TaxID=2528202 RepID=A0A4R1BCC1_9PROT|nr:hypothetical protein EZJ19_09485 [Parasulfuritortus cantonensis]